MARHGALHRPIRPGNPRGGKVRRPREGRRNHAIGCAAVLLHVLRQYQEPGEPWQRRAARGRPSGRRRRAWAAPACAVGLAVGLALAPRAAPAQGAAAAPCSEVALQRVQDTYQQLRSFQGRFEQEDRRSDGEVLKATGEIAYRRPGQMRWTYAPPNEQLLVTDGKTVWLFDPLLENVTVQPLGDLTRGTPLAFLLGVGNLARDFACRPPTRPPPGDGLRYLELTPRESIPALDYIQLGVTAEARVAALVMVDTQGNVRSVRLRDLVLNLALPPELFSFEITPGMEVIRNRAPQ